MSDNQHGKGGAGSGGDINIRGHDGDGAPRSVTVTLPVVSGLQLTPADLYGLGAVVAQWALAEYFIVAHVFSLRILKDHPRIEDVKIERNFDRLQKQWKELLRDVCAKSPDHLRIGLELAGAAKILKEDRDAAAHWPGSRDGFSLDVPARFVNVGTRKDFEIVQKTFESKDLFELSERIFRLAMDVSAFDRAIMPDLFPETVTWHGPRPEGRYLDQQPFLSIRPQPRAKETKKRD